MPINRSQKCISNDILKKILTNGNAAQYFINVFLNFARSIEMMVLSITVTLCIIHMSLTDRATNDPAIKSNNDVSTLHTPGIIIPANR